MGGQVDIAPIRTPCLSTPAGHGRHEGRHAEAARQPTRVPPDATASGPSGATRWLPSRDSNAPCPLLTTRDVATLLGLSPATVLRRWRAGELPGYRLASNVLRFRADELEAWLDERRG